MPSSKIILIFTIIVILTALLFSSSSMAQDGTTPTPEITPNASDADLMEEFEAALEYETGPGYSEDKPCELPCWWGMTPGITPEEEVIDILETTGFYRNWDLIEYGILFDSSDGPIGGAIRLDLVSKVRLDFYILFVADEGVLDRIEINIHEPNFWLPTDRFDLATVINHFNTTPVVYLNPHRMLILDLIYEEEGLIFSYWYDYLRNQERFGTSDRGVVNSFLVCSDDEIIYQTIIYLKNPDGDEPVGQEKYESPFTEPIEDVSDTDVETFINFFRETPDECLEITLKGTNGAK